MRVFLKVECSAGIETYTASWGPDGDAEHDVDFGTDDTTLIGDLKAGDYNLFWGLFGTPGASVKWTVFAQAGHPIATIADNIQPGKALRANGAFFTVP